MAKRSKKERIELGIAICNRYAEGRYTIESCCNSYSVPVRTFRGWANPSPHEFAELDAEHQKRKTKAGYLAEVAESYKKAKRQYREENRMLLKENARVSLLKLVMGFEYEEVFTEIRTDKDGSAKPVRIRKIKKYMPPNVIAVIFALKNTDPENFSDTYKAEHSRVVGVKKNFADMTDKELEDFIHCAEQKLGISN